MQSIKNYNTMEVNSAINIDSNFFSELAIQQPVSTYHFWKWLEKYREEVKWQELFNNTKRWGEPIDFFDLPVEMQEGILTRYRRDLISEGIADTEGAILNLNHNAQRHVSQMFSHFEKFLTAKNK